MNPHLPPPHRQQPPSHNHPRYNAAGQLIEFKYGNGIYGSLGYNQNRAQLNCLDYSTTNRGITCTHDSTTNFGLNYYYAVDPNCATGTSGNNGQIQCAVDDTSISITPGANGRTVAYSYDTLGRLSTAKTSGSSQFAQWGLSETYDRYGNRWSQTVTAGTGPMSSLSFGNPGGAQTNQPDGWCFDASGNLLAKSGPCPPAYPNFVYDGENRMVGDPTANWTYAYDGSGTRVEKCTPTCSSPSSSLVYIFSGSQDIAEYQNGAGASSPSTEFIYSDAIPGPGLLASVSGSSITYFQSDHLDWRVATNTSGQIIGSQGDFPFGESWYSSNLNEFVFTSYQRDSESGLDYAMARYYDSSAARFCSADPVGGDANDPQTWNRYAYARNDPIDITDPSGESWWSWVVDAAIGALTVILPEALPADFSFLGTTTSLTGETWTVGSSGGIISGTLAAHITTSTIAFSVTASVPVNAAGTGPTVNPFKDSPAFLGAKNLLKNPRCTSWLTKLAQTAGENDKGSALSPEESQYFAGQIKDIPSTLDTTPTQYAPITNPVNSEGFVTNAEAHLNTNPPSMTLYKGFFNQQFLAAQSQIVLHEAVHIVTRYGDRELARAAIGKVFPDTEKGRSEASMAWHQRLQKNCH